MTVREFTNANCSDMRFMVKDTESHRYPIHNLTIHNYKEFADREIFCWDIWTDGYILLVV